MLHGIRRRIRRNTKSAARTFSSSTLGRVFGSRSRKRNRAKTSKKWVQKVTRHHPGALRRTVKSRYGRRGFDTRGCIKPSVLEKMAHEKGVTGKRARFAKQLRRMHKR